MNFDLKLSQASETIGHRRGFHSLAARDTTSSGSDAASQKMGSATFHYHTETKERIASLQSPRAM